MITGWGPYSYFRALEEDTQAERRMDACNDDVEAPAENGHADGRDHIPSADGNVTDKDH